MFMSLNSLDSKISPHSLHSTNSESASRLTICTRGCLQGCGGPALGRAEGGCAVINPEAPLRLTTEGEFAAISRYCRTACTLVKSYITAWLDRSPMATEGVHAEPAYPSRLNWLPTISRSILDTYHSDLILRCRLDTGAVWHQCRRLPDLAGDGRMAYN